MDLQEAIRILEITDITRISEADLHGIKKKAYRRWHPDKVTATGDKETILRYQETTKKIPDALKAIRHFINDGVQTEPTLHDIRPPAEPTDIIREEAPRMQEEMRVEWENIQAEAYEMQEEEVVVAEGVPWGELLMQDLDDDIPVLCVLSFLSGFWVCIVGLLVSLIAEVEFIAFAVASAWFVQGLSCFLIALPLSRFWLPEMVSNFGLLMVNFGVAVYVLAYRGGLHKVPVVGEIIGFGINIFVLSAKAIKWVLLYPLYMLIGHLTSGAMGRVSQKVRYYFNVADWKITELLDQDPRQMSDDDLFALSWLYGKFKDFTGRFSRVA